MDTGTFVDSDKIEAFHLSPYLKDYVVCKGKELYSYDDGGSPLSFWDWNCECTCAPCNQPGFFSFMNSDTEDENFVSGWSAKYDLYNGIESYDPDWNRFWFGQYHHFMRSFKITQKCWPDPGRPTGYGVAYFYNGSGFQDLGHGYTTRVYTNVDTNEREDNYEGNCAYDGSSSGWVTGMCNVVNPGYLCKTSESVLICTDVVSDPGTYTDIKEKRLLSPLIMTLQDGESIGNSFISYDEETDSLIRGVRYKALDGRWYWYIKAKIPIRDDEEPFSVIEDCEDKKIDQELKLLLSDEHYSRLEAIIFIEDIKEK